MTYYIIRFIRPSTGVSGFLSKNREANLIYVNEALTYNTILTKDESMSRTIYDQVNGFINVEPWLSFTNDLMSYLDEAMPGEGKLNIEQFMVIAHGGFIGLEQTISLIGL